ncbi:MAG TPA: hypothetical protein VN520_32925 [Streptomyces sp.]|uniref:hypothetical protein n=1 Tax=Streptomyces sp. TaxID=1931 RepID=UPI002C2D6ABD|nr:hypothetical protein [Streptomyces sp.]HWU11107.1 hypothetical protein [Streptomyces sp.]
MNEESISKQIRGLFPMATGARCSVRRGKVAFRHRQGEEPSSGVERCAGTEPERVQALGRLPGRVPCRAGEALKNIASPPRDLMFEALWRLVGKTVTAGGEHEVM